MKKSFYLFLIVFFLTLPVFAVTVSVTFQVDMSHVTISPNGVHIAGTFQGWNPSSTPLTDMGGGIYSVTVSLTVGTKIQYKFYNGNTSGTGEITFGPCAYRTNRLYTVPSSSATVGPVCFGYCDAACTPVSGTKVACIGNSITFGANLSDPMTQSYPAQLNALLGNGYAVENFGHNGATLLKNGDVPYWTLPEFANAKTYNPDIVLIKLGTNDSKSWNWGPYGSQYIGDYNAMIDAFRALPSNPKIFVCYPAKAFSTIYSIDETVLSGQIRPDLKVVAKNKGVSIIDLFDATINDSVNFPDGVHPDVTGDAIIAARVKQMLIYSLPAITRSGDTLIAPAGDEYQWYFNGDTIAASASGTSGKLLVNQTGDYMVGVKLLSSNEDRAISQTFNVSSIFTGIKNLDFSSQVAVFPNPADDKLTLSITNNMNSIMSVKITNVFGEVLKSIEMYKNTQSFETNIDIKDLAKGIYFLEITEGEMKCAKRIIK